jgi:hypothetical protein
MDVVESSIRGCNVQDEEEDEEYEDEEEGELSGNGMHHMIEGGEYSDSPHAMDYSPTMSMQYGMSGS